MPAMTPGNNPLPHIDYYTSRPITVDTSLGPRAATEVTITGGDFRIRAQSPKVLVNGVPLARYVIAEDERSITGYFFDALERPATLVVEYDPVVRVVWAESGSPSTGGTPGLTFSPLVIALLLVLLLLIAALIVAFITQAGGLGLLLALLIAALIALPVALVLALRP